MEKYVQQLLGDIAEATKNASFPVIEQDDETLFWISEEEEDLTAPVRQLEEWTGISAHQLPPHEMLNDEQVKLLYTALSKMLDAYNCSFVMQITVPERIQYAAIRANFSQEVKVKQWHMAFFEVCPKGTEHFKCALGEYCQCAWFAELFSHFVEENLTPEEERARDLEFEIRHLQQKYGDQWTKYYPYHLDPDYDDEDGNPYNYGFDDDDDEDDTWWRK